MSKVDVQIVYLPNYAGPEEMDYKHDGDSGMDLYASFNKEGESADFIELKPGEIRIVPTGVKMLCPKGTELQVRPRGGTALKGLTVVNTPGTVDAGYTGEIGILAWNVSGSKKTIGLGERIAQIVLCPVLEMRHLIVKELDDTSRGEGAYNSTGTK